MRPLLLGRAVAALAMVLAISLGAGGGARAAEPFAGQRELLQQRLSTPAGQALPLASALVVGRLGEGGQARGERQQEGRQQPGETTQKVGHGKVSVHRPDVTVEA